MTDGNKIQLLEFASKAWGDSCAFIKDFNDGQAKIEYIDLGEYFPVFEACFAGALRSRAGKILIRKEYRDVY
ncbi:hypothetical protein JVU11DRAFT_11361 [Chiua virens]|nr:hypothetical protein JVU11DRAFT_11361 [Chiua virens]